MTEALAAQPQPHSLPEEFRIRNLRAARLAALLGVTLMPPGIPLDWLNDTALAPQFAALRISVAAACALIGALTYTRIGSSHPSVALSVVLFICGGALAYMAHRLGGFASPYYVGVLQVILAAAVVTYWSGVGTAVACGVLLLAWLIPALVEGPSSNLAAFANHLFALLICIVMAVVAAASRHRSTIREHRAAQRLAQAVDETTQALSLARAEREQAEGLLRQLTQVRAERLTWLENLARFLRHELSNQIVAVSTSIDLAVSDGSPFGSQTYLERAQRSLGRMRGLVSSATEATSLEAALTVEELERVDLSGVVMDRVTAFQDFHPSRHFTLKLRPGLSIDGNEARVAQLLDKLLSNAVEHSAEDAEIRVDLGLADRGWLELSVENEGDALPEDRARIFEAFVSSQKSAENLGLGLFVAQRIALNHGGQIRAEELRQGSGARFAVSLPKARGEGRGAASEEGHSARGERAKAVEDQPPQ